MVSAYLKVFDKISVAIGGTHGYNPPLYLGKYYVLPVVVGKYFSESLYLVSCLYGVETVLF